jgi:hypothetical protein
VLENINKGFIPFFFASFVPFVVQAFFLTDFVVNPAPRALHG